MIVCKKCGKEMRRISDTEGYVCTSCTVVGKTAKIDSVAQGLAMTFDTFEGQYAEHCRGDQEDVKARYAVAISNLHVAQALLEVARAITKK